MKQVLKSSAAALALALLIPAISATADARPMTEQDLITLKRVGSPAVSPDGQWAAYQLTTTDAASGKRNTGLWLVSTVTPNAAPVAIADLADANETSPAFAPDGKRLYFLSNKSGKDQLWYVDIGGAMTATAAVQASDTKADIAGFRLSPDGKSIAIWGDIARNCASFGCDNDGDTSKPGPGTGLQYDAMFVRHWDSWETPGNISRVFTFALTDGKLSGAGVALDGDPVTGINGDSPSKPFGGAEEIAWSRDAKSVFLTARRADAQEPLSTNLDIWQTAADGSAPPVNLTVANTALDSLPSPSPDGKYLAYVAMARPSYEADRQVLMLRDLATGQTRALTQNWDRSVDSIAWAPDSKSIIVTAQEVLKHLLFRVDVRSGAVQRITNSGSAGDATQTADGRVIHMANSALAPANLVVTDRRGKTRAITSVNAVQMAELDGVAYDDFSFTGANGDPVFGQIFKPATAPAGKLPTLLLVHGGPQGSFGDGWSWRWNPRVMAAQGYAVVTIDFHGSTGYGQAFTDSINQDWGGKPLEDLKLGMAALPGIDAQVDPANACALGGSYGGYMMNWIAGNWPDGFKCLVVHAGVFDLRAMAFETEELWFDEWDHGGPWWKRTNAEKWNPVNHVAKWKAPMLIIHGEKDFRIPYSQSLAAFTAAQRQGIESRLLIYPDENHWILKAKNSVQWHRTVFDWVGKFLKPVAKAD